MTITFRLPSIRSALEFRREEYGWTQTAMAAALGLQRSHYSEVVSGKRALPFKAACRAFEIGVPAEVLLQTPKTKRVYEARQREELQRETLRAVGYK